MWKRNLKEWTRYRKGKTMQKTQRTFTREFKEDEQLVELVVNDAKCEQVLPSKVST
jgi:hypothetical protein